VNICCPFKINSEEIQILRSLFGSIELMDGGPVDTADYRELYNYVENTSDAIVYLRADPAGKVFDLPTYRRYGVFYYLPDENEIYELVLMAVFLTGGFEETSPAIQWESERLDLNMEIHAH
jgi:hypothetical protein